MINQPRKTVSCCISASSLLCIAYIFISLNVYLDERFTDSNFGSRDRPKPRKNFLSDLKVPSSRVENALMSEMDPMATYFDSNAVTSSSIGPTVRPIKDEGIVYQLVLTLRKNILFKGL